MYSHESKTKLIYEIVDEYGGDRKPELMRKLKSLVSFENNKVKCHVRKFLETIE